MDNLSTQVSPFAQGRPTFLKRLEAAFWLTRPHIAFSKVPMAAAGWVVGRGANATSPAQAALLVLLLTSMQMLMFVVNDLNDAQKDRVTAPYLPIPSGLVSRATAIAEAGLLAAIFLGTAFLLAPNRWTFIVVLATIPAALGTLAFYSRTKAAWFSSLLGSLGSASFVAWAWFLAGHHQPRAFVLLFAVASLHGMHANLRSQIYDIEGDPKAGTMTLSARLGPRRALQTAAFVRIVELLAIGALVWIYGKATGALWLVPTVGLLVFALTRLSKAYATTRNRRHQTEELFVWVYIAFLTELSVFGAFRPMTSLVLGVFMYTWFQVVRAGYYRRLVGHYGEHLD